MAISPMQKKGERRDKRRWLAHDRPEAIAWQFGSTAEVPSRPRSAPVAHLFAERSTLKRQHRVLLVLRSCNAAAWRQTTLLWTCSCFWLEAPLLPFCFHSGPCLLFFSFIFSLFPRAFRRPRGRKMLFYSERCFNMRTRACALLFLFFFCFSDSAVGP